MSTDQSAGIPLPPPSPAERHEINELIRTVRSYTHLVVINTPNPQVGTAVLLRSGDRLFAFTAAHNVRRETAIRFRLTRDTGRTVFDVLDTYVHPGYDPALGVSRFDLAILELEPNPAVRAGDVGQLYTGRFGRPADGEARPRLDSFVWVVGYPTDILTRYPDGVRL